MIIAGIVSKSTVVRMRLLQYGLLLVEAVFNELCSVVC